MKKIAIIILMAGMSSCVDVNVDTKGAGEVAHEAGSLIRDGVKGGIELYKESKKDSIKNASEKKDTVSTWKKIKGKLIN